MIDQLRKLFSAPSAESLALKELEECKRRLLAAQTAREYADSMCKFREQQIKRLTSYIKGLE
jgi:alpha-beta hydrolase superfamily lysophospholipase